MTLRAFAQLLPPWLEVMSWSKGVSTIGLKEIIYEDLLHIFTAFIFSVMLAAKRMFRGCRECSQRAKVTHEGSIWNATSTNSPYSLPLCRHPSFITLYKIRR